jgi:hypothetical protein
MLLLTYTVWECKYNSIQKSAMALDSHYEIEYQRRIKGVFSSQLKQQSFDLHFGGYTEFEEETARGSSREL